MDLLKAENLSYSYEAAPVLSNLSLSVKRGEFLGILGENGSGKSTLALLIASLLPLQRGKIILQAIKEDNLREEMGILFQNASSQFVSPVVFDEVAFGPENLGLEEEKADERVKEALLKVGLQGFEKRLVSTLSGGEKQRLAMADLLAMKGSVLIFDESLSMLDGECKANMMREIERLRSAYTIIFITHSSEELVAADRVAVIKKGEIIALDESRKILSDIALLESAGVSAPPALYIARKLREGGLPLPEDILTPSELAEAICRLN